MMVCMETKQPAIGYDRTVGVRSTPDTRNALESLKAKLARIWWQRFRNGEPPAAQDIMNAAWLWLDSQDEDMLVYIFEHSLKRLGTILNGHPDPGGLPSGLPPNVRIGEGDVAGDEASGPSPGYAKAVDPPSPGSVAPPGYRKKRGGAKKPKR